MTRQLKILLGLLCIAVFVGGGYFYRLSMQSGLRAEILTVWNSIEADPSKIEVLRQMVIKNCSSLTPERIEMPPCLNPVTNISYFVEYIVQTRLVLNFELTKSEKMREIAEKTGGLSTVVQKHKSRHFIS